ncbi:MAG TPA: hypothetical protein VF133_12765 [Terriglobales bacterium]
MSVQNQIFWILLLLVIAAGAAAQEQIEGSTPPAATVESSVTSPFASESASFASELERTNYLDLGIGVTGSYDDNIWGEPSNRQADINYLVMPNIALRQSRGRLGWGLNYVGGFSGYKRFSGYNQGSHEFDVQGMYKVAPHVELGAENELHVTRGFFDQLNQGSVGGTVLQQPNQSVVTPFARETSNTTRIHLDDQFSASSMVGASGTFFQSHFSHAPADTLLIDSGSQEAEGYYNRRISSNSSIGLTYRFQRFSFVQIYNTTYGNSALGTFTYRPRPSLMLTFFAGPEYVQTSFPADFLSGAGSPSVSKHFWTQTGGASLLWNGERTGIKASAIRALSDGGGLLGAVTLTGGNVTIRHRLFRATTAEIGVTYGLSERLAATQAFYRFLNGGYADAVLTQGLQGNWSLSLGYAHAIQEQGLPPTGVQQINHNRAWTTISYDFSRALGNE